MEVATIALYKGLEKQKNDNIDDDDLHTTFSLR